MFNEKDIESWLNTGKKESTGDSNGPLTLAKQVEKYNVAFSGFILTTTLLEFMKAKMKYGDNPQAMMSGAHEFASNLASSCKEWDNKLIALIEKQMGIGGEKVDDK